MFDIIVYGFCLYLCDRNDLFKIASEGNRVLRKNGFIIIYDFYSESYSQNAYHHLNGIFSYKMDYSKLFCWHPAYTQMKLQLGSHNSAYITDDENERVALSVIRKLDIFT